MKVVSFQIKNQLKSYIGWSESPKAYKQNRYQNTMINHNKNYLVHVGN